MKTAHFIIGRENLLSEASRRQRMANVDLMNALRATMRRQNMLSDASRIMRAQIQDLCR